LGDRVAVINHGQILQVGKPEEVYFHPATVEVAQLFGDPEINIVDAKFRNRQATSVRVQALGEEWSLPITADISSALDRVTGDTVRLGFRPADVVVGGNGASNLRGVVYSFEPLGTKSVLTIDSVAGQRVRALVEGHRSFDVDRRVEFGVPASSLIFFDPESTRYLVRSARTQGDD
jgi:multiple sugar transport system ATP-binding protein